MAFTYSLNGKWMFYMFYALICYSVDKVDGPGVVGDLIQTPT